MGHRKIESILDLEEKERKDRLQEQWQKYIEQLDEALKSDDPLSSPLVQQIMLLSKHLFGKLQREEELRTVDILAKHDIKALREAHAPDIKQIIPLIAQALGAFGAFGLGITPLAAGYTGNKAQGFQAGASLSQNLLVTGGGSVGHLMNSMQQGEQQEASQKIQATQRVLTDHGQSFRKEQQAEERAGEMQQTINKQRHDTFQQMAGG